MRQGLHAISSSVRTRHRDVARDEGTPVWLGRARSLSPSPRSRGHDIATRSQRPIHADASVRDKASRRRSSRCAGFAHRELLAQGRLDLVGVHRWRDEQPLDAVAARVRPLGPRSRHQAHHRSAVIQPNRRAGGPGGRDAHGRLRAPPRSGRRRAHAARRTRLRAAGTVPKAPATPAAAAPATRRATTRHRCAEGVA
jgi:hypothetical protein